MNDVASYVKTTKIFHGGPRHSYMNDTKKTRNFVKKT